MVVWVEVQIQLRLAQDGVWLIKDLTLLLLGLRSIDSQTLAVMSIVGPFLRLDRLKLLGLLRLGASNHGRLLPFGLGYLILATGSDIVIGD